MISRTRKSCLSSLLSSATVLILMCSEASAVDPIRTIVGEFSAGTTLTWLGDVNGDNIDDLAVGEPDYGGNRGRVIVYSGADNREVYRLTGNYPAGEFGHALASVDDLDGDDVSDLVIGAPRVGPYFTGEVTVHSGASGAQVGSFRGGLFESFGSSVCDAGDMDGDGFGDFAMGRPGRILVISGAQLQRIYEVSYVGWESIGKSLAGGSDLDGDGWPDIVASGDPGQMFMLSGPTGKLDLDIYVPGSQLGEYIAIVGDMNGDGLDDFAGVDPDHNSRMGAVYFFTGLNKNPRLIVEGTYDFVINGAVASAGDLDGDGKPEFIVGGSTQLTTDGAAVFSNDGQQIRWLLDTQIGSFGTALTELRNGRVHIGAPNVNTVYTYDLTGSRRMFALGGASDSEFGSRVDVVRDFDGDGTADVIVTSAGSDAAHIYSGGNRQLLATWTSSLVSEGIVSDAGDVDGDGLSDVVVGLKVHSYVNGEIMALPVGVASAVCAVGDVNGDGRDDVAVGYSGHDGARGQVKVVGMDTNGVTQEYWTIKGSVPNEQLGRALAGGGDFDADRIEDLVVGSAGTGDGWIGVYSTAAKNLIIQKYGDPGDDIGGAFAFGGDFNNDSRDDLIVGYPGFSAAAIGTGSGKVEVLKGGRASEPGTFQVIHRWIGQNPADHFGRVVDSAGDFDGDLMPDVVVGIPDGPRHSALGGIMVRSGRDGRILLHAGGIDQLDLMGSSVSGGWDVNLDGVGDIVFGIPGADEVQVWRGRATTLHIHTPTPGLLGQVNTIAVSNAEPNGEIMIYGGSQMAVNSSQVDPLPVLKACPGARIQIADAELLEVVAADVNGDVSIDVIPSNQVAGELYVQAIELETCRTTPINSVYMR